MRKIKMCVATIATFYVVAFFLAAPLYLFAMQKGSSPASIKLGQIIGTYDTTANGWVVTSFGQDNLLSQLRIHNSSFWCSKFEDCSEAEKSG